MATGLFAIYCPGCGDLLAPTLPEEADCPSYECPSCEQRFLTRCGYMIPVRESTASSRVSY